MKGRLRRRWQLTRDPALKAKVNRLQRAVTRRLNEWRNDQWSVTLESLDPEDQSLWRMTKRVTRFYTTSPPGHTWGTALLASEKADSLETQFQPVTNPSVPAVIEMVDVALRSHIMTPARESKLTNPKKVQEAIRGLRIGKARGPNGIPNRALKNLPWKAVSLLVRIFNAVLLTHHFTTVWKHARLISILNRGRIQHCRHPIGPLVSWARLVNYLKISY
jgi:hypothetical protein